jgi:hypothetical protein
MTMTSRALALCLMTAVTIATPVFAEGKIAHCEFGGKLLQGKVQVVQSFPDFKVKVVTGFPDLKVQRVTSFPDRCGKWQFVTSFPDFKIQYVDSFPDFTVQWVESFPGDE